jgi:hypothetical protein
VKLIPHFVGLHYGETLMLLLGWPRVNALATELITFRRNYFLKVKSRGFGNIRASPGPFDHSIGRSLYHCERKRDVHLEGLRFSQSWL